MIYIAGSLKTLGSKGPQGKAGTTEAFGAGLG